MYVFGILKTFKARYLDSKFYMMKNVILSDTKNHVILFKQGLTKFYRLKIHTVQYI